MLRLKNLVKKLHNSNLRSIFKIVIVVAVVSGLFYAGNPVSHYMGEWTHDLAWYGNNNTSVGGYSTWVNLSTPTKIVFILFPGVFIVPLLAWYAFVTRTHRKRLVLNGYPEGTVMWTYNIEPNNSHLYDIICALKGFDRVDWDNIHLPISMGFYDGLKVIYYKTSTMESPLEWHRLVIDDEKQIRITPYNIYVDGKYTEIIKHPDNLILSYIHVHAENDYVRADPDMDTLKIYHKNTIKRIQRDNIEILQSNPDIAGEMIKSSLMVIPPGVKKDFLDLLTDQEREDYIRESRIDSEQ